MKQKIYFIIFLTTLGHTIFTAEKPQNNALIRNAGYWTGPQTLTPPGSQREDWHKMTKYVAEPLCTISNIPFFLAAYIIKEKNPLSALALTVAGSASAASHMIPYKRLNDIDKIAAICSVIAVGYESNCYTLSGLINMIHDKKRLASVLALGGVYASDIYFARSKEIVKKFNLDASKTIKRKSYHAWIHVIWHLLAAFTAYIFLAA